jgi:hypothetical protein
MPWITATSLDDREVNLQTQLIAAILTRVPGRPDQGSTVLLASGSPLEVRESPAELLRLIDTGEHPENPPASPGEAW